MTLESTRRARASQHREHRIFLDGWGPRDPIGVVDDSPARAM
jgi:hypothetical protein